MYVVVNQHLLEPLKFGLDGDLDSSLKPLHIVRGNFGRKGTHFRDFSWNRDPFFTMLQTSEIFGKMDP